MAEAYSLSVWTSSLALESKLSRNLESHTVLVPRLSHYEWKNLKNNLFRMNVLYIENGFYCFSSEDVFSCRATSDDDSPCLIGRIDYTLSNVYVRILWKTVWLFHFILVPLHHLPVKGRMISPLRWRVSGQLVWHIVGKNREAHASSCSLEPEKFQLDTR